MRQRSGSRQGNPFRRRSRGYAGARGGEEEVRESGTEALAVLEARDALLLIAQWREVSPEVGNENASIREQPLLLLEALRDVFIQMEDELSLDLIVLAQPLPALEGRRVERGECLDLFHLSQRHGVGSTAARLPGRVHGVGLLLLRRRGAEFLADQAASARDRALEEEGQPVGVNPGPCEVGHLDLVLLDELLLP